jgi:hypothetical protein
MLSAENGHLEVVKLLVRTGADKDKESKVIIEQFKNMSCTFLSINCSGLDIVKLLTFASCL